MSAAAIAAAPLDRRSAIGSGLLHESNIFRINGTSESCIRLSASSLIDQQIVRIAFVSVMDWRRYSVRAATVSVGCE